MASDIDEDDIEYWNNKLDSYTESDPIFEASVASEIDEDDIANWNNKLDSYTETDPIFEASVASEIDEDDIEYWNNKLDSYTETDPIFEASVASDIDEDDIEYWNNKLDSYTETDPIFEASVASDIDEDDIANWNNKLDSYTETDPVFEASVASDIDEDDIEYWNNKQNKLTAGNKIIIEDDVISVDGPAPLALGDSYQGGIIYWLDETGQHGLIVSTEDQSDGIQWRNSVHRYTGAKGNGLYAGKMNTALIIAAQLDDVEDADFAAKLCAEYSVTFKGITYGDWYLPSIYELDLLYAFKAQGGIEIEGIYWSSTEHNKSNARYKNLFSGGGMDIPKSTTYKVRAIRSF